MEYDPQNNNSLACHNPELAKTADIQLHINNIEEPSINYGDESDDHESLEIVDIGTTGQIPEDQISLNDSGNEAEPLAAGSLPEDELGKQSKNKSKTIDQLPMYKRKQLAFRKNKGPNPQQKDKEFYKAMQRIKETHSHNQPPKKPASAYIIFQKEVSFDINFL